jgi:hypothetical protein
LLKKANKRRVDRYAATSRPAAPEATDAMTHEEAARQLNDLHIPQPDPEPAPEAFLPEPTQTWGGTAAAHQPHQAQELGLDNDRAPEWYALPEPTPTWGNAVPASPNESENNTTSDDTPER